MYPSSYWRQSFSNLNVYTNIWGIWNADFDSVSQRWSSRFCIIGPNFFNTPFAYLFCHITLKFFTVKGKSSVDPRFFMDSAFWICLLVNIICNPQINAHVTSTVICRHAQWQKDWVPSWGWAGNFLPSCFRSHTRKQVSFLQFIQCHIFLQFCTFCWWSQCTNVPGFVQMFCPVFPNTRRLWCVLSRKYVYQIQSSSMSYGIFGQKFNVNDSTIYIIWGLSNRNTLHEVMYWSVDENVIRGS